MSFLDNVIEFFVFLIVLPKPIKFLSQYGLSYLNQLAIGEIEK